MNFFKINNAETPTPTSGNARATRELAHLDREEIRPDVIAQLESLDDVIFAAIDGDPVALQESSKAWQSALSELGADTIEETRRQYLRHAQSVWESLRRQKVQPPHKIFAAIEVIGLLVNVERT